MSTSGWGGVRRRVTPERVELVAIALFALFVIWPFVQRDRMVVSFDGLAYSGPNLRVTLDAIKAGELPLWNRFLFGGVSHAGNPQTGFWYLPTLLGLPFSATRALNLLSAAHLALFAGGMVALCRWQLRLRPPATFVGTVVALGGGAMASKTIQFEQLLVVAWVPLLLALLHWLIAGQRPWRAAGCLTLATAAWLTAGHPQIQYLTAPVLVVWGVAIALDTDSGRRLIGAAGAALLGAVVALPHLVLAYQATGSSALSGGRTLDDIRDLGWLPGRTIVPGLLGDPTAPEHGVLTHGFEATTYIGAAAAVLAVIGFATGLLLAHRRFATIGLGLVVAVCLTLATGPITPLFRLAFDEAPGFDLARVAARWVLPASICLAVLAAYGADAAREANPALRHAGAIGVVLAIAAATIAMLAYLDEVPGRRVAVGWIVVAAITFGAWLRRPRTNRAALACLLVPALLVGAELTIAARHSFARNVSTTHAPETATGDALTFLRQHPEGRTLALTFDALGDQTYLAPALRPNVNATFGIPSIDGYDGGVQITERWFAVFQQQVAGFDPDLTLRAQIGAPLDPATWGRLGVRYVVVDTSGIGVTLLSGWTGPLVTGNLEVYENPAWAGDAVAWSATTPVGTVDDAAQRLRADPASTSASVEAGEALTCNADCAPVGLAVDRRSPGDIVVQSGFDHETLLTIDEQFDDGWHATVDGASAQVVAVDGIKAGVIVPSGAHEVRFTYRPAGLTGGIAASVIAALAALALIAFEQVAGSGWFRQRRDALRDAWSRR